MKKANLNYENLVGIATDGAPAMVGEQKGVQGMLKKELQTRNIPQTLIWCHCIIHQESLCTKVIGFQEIMAKIISTVNFIRARALNHRQFKELLEELAANYKDVLYFSQVRWLSRGRTLKRVWELREEIAQFMESKGRPLLEFSDEQWLCDFAFLVDITEKLNQLNVSMQGKDKLVHNLFGDIKSFEAKLLLWKSQLENNVFDHFPCLEIQKELKPEGGRYSTEIEKLTAEFSRRFQEFRANENDFKIFSMPFSVDPVTAPTNLQLELIDLQNNMDLKAQCLSKPLVGFYKDCVSDESSPNLLHHAMKTVTLFGSTYLCEQFFSKLKYSKSKNRNSISDEHLENTLRIASSRMKPDICAIMNQKKQFHPSH
ncbi:GTF2IRD2B (predicted) [Pycnogonum litorale]